MSSKKNDDRKNVVIVGGGVSGTITAKALSAKLDASKYNLIIINPLPYTILYPATLRMVVTAEDNIESSALVPFTKTFHDGNGTFLQGKVQSIQKNSQGKGGTLLLENGESVPYEVLILASGSIWTGPIGFPETQDGVTDFIQKSRSTLKDAQSIVLAGGGAVGIEYAGEVKHYYPNKKVTIVQGDNALLNNTYPMRYRKAFESRLHARGVEVIFDDYIDTIPAPGQDVTTRNGKVLQADLVLSTRGPRPNTGFIVSSLGSEVATAQGIFVVGDVLDLPEQKQFAKVAGHATVVTKNIQSYLAGQPLGATYKGGSEAIVVTLGKTGGVGYIGMLWGIVLGDWFARLIKSKSLMISMMRSAVGYW
ncbi:FAD/NAD(P)-binding domain-containing protein [Infundibulicybe gibba]|nr:FAD/NAD(P)-binding domain-containing protein [Infundibulicybe gibba]